MKVLITDDAKFMRVMLSSIIEKEGYTVVEASNGVEALEVYKVEQPDIVFMDITMPVLDGISAVKNILKFDSKARIIMCSAMGQQAMVIEAIQSGAKDFIVKPFQAERVVNALYKYA